MRGYSVAVRADVRRRMSPSYRQCVSLISAELGIYIVTLYNWRRTWRLQGKVVLHQRRNQKAGALLPPMILHADNSNAINWTTIESLLEEISKLRSFPKPRVLNDNPYSESLYRTLK